MFQFLIRKPQFHVEKWMTKQCLLLKAIVVLELIKVVTAASSPV